MKHVVNLQDLNAPRDVPETAEELADMAAREAAHPAAVQAKRDKRALLLKRKAAQDYLDEVGAVLVTDLDAAQKTELRQRIDAVVVP